MMHFFGDFGTCFLINIKQQPYDFDLKQRKRVVVVVCTLQLIARPNQNKIKKTKSDKTEEKNNI